jgi:anti-sigma regulatory factor (Ser/Thr protein kinase)
MPLRLEVPISLAGLAAAQEAAEAWAEPRGVPPAQALRLRLVTEELLANLIEHAAWPAEPTPARLEVAWQGGVLSLTLEDAAAPFDPRHAAAAVPSLEGDEVGGLGLALVRRMAQRLDYGRTEAGSNRTSIDIRA